MSKMIDKKVRNKINNHKSQYQHLTDGKDIITFL